MGKWEPVRTWLYGLLGPLAAIAVAYGWINDEQSVLWVALITAALSVVGTEIARSKVIPVDKVEKLYLPQGQGPGGGG